MLYVQQTSGNPIRQIVTHEDLQAIWTDHQEPGHYRPERRDKGALFAFGRRPTMVEAASAPADRGLQVRDNVEHIRENAVKNNPVGGRGRGAKSRRTPTPGKGGCHG